MTITEPKKQLYTCNIRCHFCLRILASTHHVEKLPGILVNYNECPLHKDKGVEAEWVPEEAELEGEVSRVKR